MDLFNMSHDDLSAIEREMRDGATIDQKLKVAEIKALLSISQQLSIIHHQGISPDFDDSI